MVKLIAALFKVVKVCADDSGFNQAIKKSKDFKTLTVNLIAWVLPLVVAYAVKRLEGSLEGGQAKA